MPHMDPYLTINVSCGHVVTTTAVTSDCHQHQVQSSPSLGRLYHRYDKDIVLIIKCRLIVGMQLILGARALINDLSFTWQPRPTQHRTNIQLTLINLSRLTPRGAYKYNDSPGGGPCYSVKHVVSLVCFFTSSWEL